MRRTKKGQGALEFLMTYGWAFLVILIMVGALAYFGVLNPSRFLPDRCQFGNPLLCHREQFTIRSDDSGTVIAKLTNNYGAGIKLYGAELTTDYPSACQSGSYEICIDENEDNACTGADENLTSTTTEVDWAEGVSRNLVVDCSDGTNLAEGEKVKFILKFKWFPQASSDTFAKDTQGEIYSAVQ